MAGGSLDYGVMRDEEMDPLNALLEQALFFNQGGMAPWTAALGQQNMRAVRRDGRLMAGLGIIPMGHWFGGVAVPAAGITAVGVAPEYRGSGVGLLMLREMLQEIHEQGMPISTLYPATTAFYRRAGYERAAPRTIYEMAVEGIQVRDHTLEAVAVEDAHFPELQRLYDRRAAISAGQMARPDFLWDLLLRPKDRLSHKYMVLRDGQPEGYVIFFQGPRSEPLNIRDLVVLTPEAGRRLLALLADHRTMVDAMRWAGAPNDPQLFLMPEQKAKVHWQLDLMLRLVDVPAALSARGYPASLSAELHLEVVDELLPWNNGRFVLQVRDGRGQAEAGGQGRLRLHVRDLAALYAGYYTAPELQMVGAVQGEAADYAAAGLIFSGPRPWIPDMF